MSASERRARAQTSDSYCIHLRQRILTKSRFEMAQETSYPRTVLRQQRVRQSAESEHGSRSWST
eukprot:43109-Eustigmatos_ZCMA.PRE.1